LTINRHARIDESAWSASRNNNPERPTVLIRGGIAVVWAPYEFWIDGETSHCGIDVVDFVKIGGTWLVSNSMWTVEPDACAGLRPAGAAELRP